MKSFLVLLAATLACCCETVADEPTQIRVLSYNIHHGQGVDGKLDLQRIANVIRSVKPDLVALQEVDQGTTRSDGVDQPVELAGLCGMKIVFGKNISFQGGNYGNAVLAGPKILSHENVHLPRFGDSEQRGVLICQVRLASGQQLAFLATHFDHRRPNQERLASVERIRKAIIDLGARPTILAGDLNDIPGSAVLNALEQDWQVAKTSPAPSPTIPVAKPTRQIDFVLYRPQDRWRTIEVKVLSESVASDHRAILAVLELLPKR